MKTNKAKRAEGHKSKILSDLISEISPREQARTDNKMLLAAKIDEARKAKGWSQTKFAEEMGKQPSEISKWLSGTHNFTVDTLWDIEEKLDIAGELIAVQEKPSKVIKVMTYTTTVSGPAKCFYPKVHHPLVGKDFYKIPSIA